MEEILLLEADLLKNYLSSLPTRPKSKLLSLTRRLTLLGCVGIPFLSLLDEKSIQKEVETVVGSKDMGEGGRVRGEAVRRLEQMLCDSHATSALARDLPSIFRSRWTNVGSKFLSNRPPILISSSRFFLPFLTSGMTYFSGSKDKMVSVDRYYQMPEVKRKA